MTHDHARYVNEALTSALTQDVDEIVVVDDGSTDGTTDVVRTVRDPRVRLIARPNRGITGLAETYSAGLDACRGDIVAILEGDDRWPAGTIAQHRAAFADPRVVVSHGRYSVIGARGDLLHEGVAPSTPLAEGVYDARPHLLRASYIMSVTAAIRRNVIVRVGGFAQLPGTPHWDYPTFLRLSEEGPFHFTHAVLGEWRRHGRSATYRLASVGRSQIDEGISLSIALALDARKRMAGPGLPSVEAITAGWRSAEGHSVWQSARILLIGERYVEAQQLIRAYLWRPYPLGIRLRLLLALAASRLHLNIEALLRFLSRRSPLDQLD